MQVPLVHPSARSELQAFPQPPQWLALELVSTHSMPQHACVPGQTRPHAPQCATLFVVLTHDPLQHTVPPVHAGPAPHRHAPPAHVSPAAHGGSHGTSAVQLPPLHTLPAAHAFPHPPQFMASVAKVRHVPPQQA